MKTASMKIAMALCSLTALPGFAAEGSVDRLVTCSAETDDRRRLACFDREIAPFKASRPATPPAATVTTPRAAAPSAAAAAPPPPPVAVAPSRPAASLGEEQVKSKDRPPATEEEVTLHARIASIRTAGTGAWLVTLDNGQAWRHENEHLGSYLEVGEPITIRKATFGTYRLTRDAGEEKNWIRVMRTR